jgi:hypothetical protein
MTIASLNFTLALRALAVAAPLALLACGSDLPTQPGNQPTRETAPSASEEPDDVHGPQEHADAATTRPKPADASSAAVPVDGAPATHHPGVDGDAGVDGPERADAASAPDAATSSPKETAVKSTTDAGAAVDVVDEAFEALRLGNKKKWPKLIAALDERVKQRPEDGMAVFYSGAMRFWKLIEGTNGVVDLVQNLSLPDEILSRFSRARTLLPDDFRVPAFYGLVQTSFGMLAGDSDLSKAGAQTLEQAIALYPAYGYFLRASATSPAAIDDPLFATTMSDMEGIFRECLIERRDGEVTYTYPQGPKVAARPHICLNDSIIPHVWEGTLISFGDMALKAGWGAERVRALYRSARTAPNYADWPFAAMLEARIEEAEEHARLYADANPLNDPLPWAAQGNLCVGCHQER